MKTGNQKTGNQVCGSTCVLLCVLFLFFLSIFLFQMENVSCLKFVPENYFSPEIKLRSIQVSILSVRRLGHLWNRRAEYRGLLFWKFNCKLYCVSERSRRLCRHSVLEAKHIYFPFRWIQVMIIYITKQVPAAFSLCLFAESMNVVRLNHMK